jgi:hypothetical protein
MALGYQIFQLIWILTLKVRIRRASSPPNNAINPEQKSVALNRL